MKAKVLIEPNTKIRLTSIGTNRITQSLLETSPAIVSSVTMCDNPDGTMEYILELRQKPKHPLYFKEEVEMRVKYWLNLLCYEGEITVALDEE
ncbi:MAG: hypothetical protein BIFFINMI_02382 [Phycisphaerae bacterium]|nr:hypothetical protein [Phycisphaerae bacterium]